MFFPVIKIPQNCLICNILIHFSEDASSWNKPFFKLSQQNDAVFYIKIIKCGTVIWIFLSKYILFFYYYLMRIDKKNKTVWMRTPRWPLLMMMSRDIKRREWRQTVQHACKSINACPHGLFKAWEGADPATLAHQQSWQSVLHLQKKRQRPTGGLWVQIPPLLNSCWIRKLHESLVLRQQTNPNWAALGENNSLHLHHPNGNRNSENSFWQKAVLSSFRMPQTSTFWLVNVSPVTTLCMPASSVYLRNKNPEKAKHILYPTIFSAEHQPISCLGSVAACPLNRSGACCYVLC